MIWVGGLAGLTFAIVAALGNIFVTDWRWWALYAVTIGALSAGYLYSQ